MTDFEFSARRPDHWDNACEQAGSLFQSADWQQLLAECFRTETVYAWDKEQTSATAISLFPAGPFRIGYLGFPLGRLLGNGALRSILMSQLATGLAEWSPLCVRVQGSAFIESDELQLPAVITPETAIPDLQAWSHHSVSTNVRRDLKKAAGAGLELVDAESADDGVRLYKVYVATIKRHRGSLRYNARYFSRLIELAATRQDLRVITARKHGDIAGFFVLVMDADTAYYLHGGTNFELPNYHSAPLLFEAAIEAAKSRGLRCFNFMSSPADQPTLVRYKEKWGGITRQHKTYVLALRPAYQLFKVAEKFYGMIRHAR
jgi:hypothetical protein